MIRGRILLVDDEETFLRSTAELLRQKQFACDEAVDGEEAAAMVKETSYDVVVADIKMPGNTELELVRQLEGQEPALPVILVTGYPSVKTAVDSVNLDVLAYLVKPIDMEELLAHVRRGVRRRKVRQLVRRMQRRARERVQDLERIDDSLEAEPVRLSEPLEAIFEAAFQHIADSYLDLRQLFSIMEERRPEMLAAGLRNDPEKQRLVKALQDAIEALEETKQAFKSKQLAELRERLETALEQAAA